VSSRNDCQSIYIIGDGEFVKIGIATDPAQRLTALQTGNPRPLKLLAQFIGDREFEAKLHRDYAHLRVHGEWFRVEDQIQWLIDIFPPEAS
jgi:hypothetical protein